MTYGVPTHGESANRFPGEDARRRPGRSRPKARALGPHEARPSSLLPASLFALVFPWADVLPRSTLWLGLKGPAVSVGFQTQACDSLDSPKPPAAPRCWRSPQVPGWGTQPAGCLHRLEHLRAGVVLSGKGS